MHATSICFAFCYIFHSWFTNTYLVFACFDAQKIKLQAIALVDICETEMAFVK